MPHCGRVNHASSMQLKCSSSNAQFIPCTLYKKGGREEERSLPSFAKSIVGTTCLLYVRAAAAQCFGTKKVVIGKNARHGTKNQEMISGPSPYFYPG